MSAFLSQLAGSPFATFLAALAVKATAVLAVGFIAQILLARASAAARHLAWVVTFVALAVLPAVALAPPLLDLAVLPPAAAAAADPDPNPDFDPDVEAGFAIDAAGPDDVEVDGELSGLPSLAELTAAAEGDDGGGAGFALGALYAAGLLLLVGWIALGLVSVRRLTDTGRAAGAPWTGLLAALGRRLALGRPVSLVVSERVRVPMVWGAARPTVLLPDAAADWPDAHRRDALLHELSHVARGDWPVQLFARAVTALYWFHPLAWMALARLRLEAERACDDGVLAAGSASCDYAERLVDLARSSSLFAPRAAVAMSGRHQLAHRIRSLLDAGRRRAPLGRWAAVALAVALLVPALAVASAQLVERGAVSFDAGELIADAGAALAGRGDRDRGRRSSRRAVVRTPLMEAAAAGDLAAVEGRLAAGDDPDGSEPGNGTPLILAADAGHAPVVARLLAAGADPNDHETGRERWDDLPRSPLGAAARSGDVETIQLLLEAGAEVDDNPRGDATALMIAAARGHVEATRLLLAAGADPGAEVKGDGTPLIEAARGGSAPIVRLLLEAGADPTVGIAGDGNPMIWAARRGDTEMVEAFLSAGAEPDDWVRGDESPFFHAVARGDADMVRVMLAAGADPNQEWRGDGSPLIVATGNGHREVVEELLRAGARPNVGVRGDGNALIQAAANGDLGGVDRLLAAGADPDAAVEGDGNALIAAAAGGHLDVVERLLDEGAAIDLVVPGDENALIQAAGGGHLEVVRFLVDQGADVNKRVVERSWRGERDVRSPLAMAKRGGHEDVVRFLESRGATE
ncbi:MAG TPA: ankyrin repeat domain-containing protein [Thermoanaerobaculia bacterium]|nr:ankyrin repeat domain-containing protein [Thermoanaerobaculia bacterium]